MAKGQVKRCPTFPAITELQAETGLILSHTSQNGYDVSKCVEKGDTLFIMMGMHAQAAITEKGTNAFQNNCCNDSQSQGTS